MFAIYNQEGRRFRDTLENLHKAYEVRIDNRMASGANMTGFGTGALSATDAASAGQFGVSSKAVQAYRDMRHLKQREPVYHAYQLMSHPVITVSVDMGILDAHRHLQAHGYQQMPVINAQHRIVGMLSAKDLLQFIIIDGEEMHYVDDKRVADVMSTEVITTDPVSDIRRVAQVMQEYHLYATPIVNEQDVLVGIVSRGDILRAVMNDQPLNTWS
jgi:CBS-domain-containing membrane protein